MNHVDSKKINDNTARVSIHDGRATNHLLRDLARPYTKWLIVLFLAMIIETAMSLAAPWPLKIVLDSVVGKYPMPGWLSSFMDGLNLTGDKMALALACAILVVLIAAVSAFASYLENYYTEYVSQNVANDLRQRIYHHLQRLSLPYYESHQVGKLMSTITTDVTTIQDFISSSLLGILINALTIFGMIGIMFVLNWDFTLIAVSVTPFLVMFLKRFRKAVKKATHDMRDKQSSMVSVLQQGLDSIRSVIAFGRQDLEESRLQEASHQTVAAALHARKIKSLVSPTVGIIIALCTAVVLWRGAHLIVAGAMTIGSLMVFLNYLGKFFKPVQDLAKMTNTIAQTSVGLERVMDILNADAVIPQKPGAVMPEKIRGEISFEHVSFAYDGRHPVLRDIHFSVKPGEKIGICGPTGSGKSTVVSMIPRFYDPDSGRVLIDGTDVTEFDLQGLRNQIAFVLQDTVLFYGSVRENIAYGKPNATNDEIETAARLANCEEFILKMPERYDTLVSERGLSLSGGQRQRIGIARAIIRNSPILILDEPTAALDSLSEHLVLDALEKLMKDKTVMIITHRLSAIRYADRILVLNDGCITEEGKHDELLALNKEYASLYRIQEGTKPDTV
ncbi:ABC transporter ATP-binding protein [Pollutibacter soli]|uniref:ABC transporter ATP-binding protein n=1 Tax=Pollutibacter soli TaxID=3034157 RepID=UPI0030140C87